MRNLSSGEMDEFVEKWNAHALTFRFIDRATGNDVTEKYSDDERIGMYGCFLAECPDVERFDMVKETGL